MRFLYFVPRNTIRTIDDFKQQQTTTIIQFSVPYKLSLNFQTIILLLSSLGKFQITNRFHSSTQVYSFVFKEYILPHFTLYPKLKSIL